MISVALAVLETEEQRNLLSEFYEQNKNRLYLIAFSKLHNRQSAEDAVMETLLRIADKPERLEGEEWLQRVYINRSNNTRITFNQKTKAMFEAHYPDFANRKFEEVDINGNKGYLWRDSHDRYGYTMKTLVWDNGKYIFELHGEVSEKMLINLAKSAKCWGE